MIDYFKLLAVHSETKTDLHKEKNVIGAEVLTNGNYQDICKKIGVPINQITQRRNISVLLLTFKDKTQAVYEVNLNTKKNIYRHIFLNNNKKIADKINKLVINQYDTITDIVMEHYNQKLK